MSWWDSISLALTSLRLNKMRSLLTLLGVIIGIAAVITILTLGKSLKAQAFEGLESLGASDYTVQIQQRNNDEDDKEAAEEEQYLGFYEPVEDPQNRISVEMIDQLKEHFQNRITGAAVGETSNHQGTLSFGEKNKKVTLKATNADFLKLKNLKLQYGRTFTEEDILADRAVAIISPTALDELFQGDANRALGAEVEFEATGGFASFTVIGIYEDPKKNIVSEAPISTLYVPYPSERRITDASETWEQLKIRANPNVDAATFKKDLQNYVDQWYTDNAEYRAKVSDLEKELDQFNKMLTSMSVALSAIGGISLLVGGIGVMNIMLITVTERTREIGVRKALGATRRDIRLQFVVESMIVCLIGGIVGVILGGTFGILGAKLLGTLVFPPIIGVVVSLLFSLAIGLFFGYYPANKAAKLNPIEALRYE